MSYFYYLEQKEKKDSHKKGREKRYRHYRTFKNFSFLFFSCLFFSFLFFSLTCYGVPSETSKKFCGGLVDFLGATVRCVCYTNLGGNRALRPSAFRRRYSRRNQARKCFASWGISKPTVRSICIRPTRGCDHASAINLFF